MRWPFQPRHRLADAGPLYARIVAEMRRADWYQAAGVPDTMDGRFAVLASLLALADLRLGHGGDEAHALAPRLTERFVADMDVQMREAGFGDPSLGKQVRQLVAALAARIERLRHVAPRDADWNAAVSDVLYKGQPPAETQLAQASHLLADWHRRLDRCGDHALGDGAIDP